MKTVIFKIKGMSCENAIPRIGDVKNRVPGILFVNTRFKEEKSMMQLDDDTNIDDIIDFIEEELLYYVESYQILNNYSNLKMFMEPEVENYSDKLKECFLNPRGYGDILNYKCEKTIQNEIDGVFVVFKINIKSNKIYFKYKVNGCVAVIAVCCAIYDLYNGKTKQDILQSANMENISLYLDGIPQSKTRCAQYALDAFIGAISQCDDQ